MINFNSFEISNLFNPAFCGLVLSEAIISYSNEDPKGMPYALMFLVLPIVLHAETRASFPATSRTTVHAWLAQNPHLRIGFAERCLDLKTVTMNGLELLLANEKIEFSQAATFLGDSYLNSVTEHESKEVVLIRKSSRILGKLLANAGTPATVFAMWGVKP